MNRPHDRLSDRIGRAINELDIDFSRFTAAGWLLVVVTLSLGVAVGWTVYGVMPQRGPLDKAPALIPPAAGFFVCVGTFLLFRALLKRAGIPVTKPRRDE